MGCSPLLGRRACARAACVFLATPLAIKSIYGNTIQRQNTLGMFRRRRVCRFIYVPANRRYWQVVWGHGGGKFSISARLVRVGVPQRSFELRGMIMAQVLFTGFVSRNQGFFFTRGTS